MDHHAEHCLSCRHVLGAGRFCVNCGHPRPPAVRGATTPEPRHDPALPPPVYEAPPPARYPLFADEAVPGPVEWAELPDSPGSPGSPGPAGSAPVFPTPGLAETAAVPVVHPSSDRRVARPGTPWWIAAVVAAVALLGLGGYAVLGGSDPLPSAGDRPAPGTASPTTTTSTTTSPDGETGSEDAEPDVPLDLARLAQASPPDTAAASRDVNGNAVRYEAFNMLDGQPDTAWRMPGDASGREIVFRFDGPTRITQVGLINGYAKVEPGYDGYAANRRITSVEWEFADGTVIAQDLGDALTLQSADVDVVSDVVTLRILAVTDPAPGPSGRDYTAISDVSLVGAPV